MYEYTGENDTVIRQNALKTFTQFIWIAYFSHLASRNMHLNSFR